MKKEERKGVKFARAIAALRATMTEEYAPEPPPRFRKSASENAINIPAKTPETRANVRLFMGMFARPFTEADDEALCERCSKVLKYVYVYAPPIAVVETVNEGEVRDDG